MAHNPYGPQDPLAELDRLASLDSMEGLTRAEVTRPPPFYTRLPYGAFAYAVYPGLFASVVIGLAATFLSDHYGAPVMLFALLIGMIFHFLHESGRAVAGIEFASRTVLRLGVALLGARVTLDQIAGLGVAPVLLGVFAVVTTIGVGVLAARAMKLSLSFGLLSGGAVGICGVAAAMAISAVLPKSPQRDRDTILAVMAVASLSTIAMILYPLLVGNIGLTDNQAGVFLGGAIHDVAQVVGAGFMISPQTGDVATYVKMLRVAMLLPVVVLIALLFAQGSSGRTMSAFPTFLAGFIVLVLINSLNVIPAEIVSGLSELSKWCLVTSIAALGMKTSLKDLASVGWKPVALMIGETVWIGGLALAAVWFFV